MERILMTQNFYSLPAMPKLINPFAECELQELAYDITVPAGIDFEKDTFTTSPSNPQSPDVCSSSGVSSCASPSDLNCCSIENQGSARKRPLEFENCSRRNSETSQPKLKFRKTVPNESCQICEGEASGVHFGVFSCEGCKRFFQRASAGAIKKLFCRKGTKNCDVTGARRTQCKYCRFNKCVKLGMSTSVIKLGRAARKQARALPPPDPDKEMEILLVMANEKFMLGKQRTDKAHPSDTSQNCAENSKLLNQEPDIKCKLSNVQKCEVRPVVRFEEIMSSIFEKYITELYVSTKSRIVEALSNSACKTSDVIICATDASIAFLSQLPGIDVGKIKSNEQIAVGLQNVCLFMMLRLCLSSIALLNDSSVFIPTESFHQVTNELIAEFPEMQNWMRSNSLAKLALNSEKEQVFDFLSGVLQALEELPTNELTNNVQTLKHQTKIAFSNSLC